MSNEKSIKQRPMKPTISVDEVNRVLEVGRLLCSVLHPEEIQALEELLRENTFPNGRTLAEKIGNTGVT